MSGELIVRCGDCGYWRKDGVPPNHGECRYNPPVLHSDGDSSGFFPVTHKDSGCGKGLTAIFHKSKRTEQD